MLLILLENLMHISHAQRGNLGVLKHSPNVVIRYVETVFNLER